MDIQLKRGILDICVLSTLCNKDGYGYQIIKDISGIIQISESTLYPILRRLEQAKCLTTYSKEYEGRLRKYYKITENGKIKINNFLEEWKDVAKVYDHIVKAMGGKNE